MSLPYVATDLHDDQGRKHRTLIAQATNELIKVRPPHDRTQAEISASSVVLDPRYAPGNIRRYGSKGDGVTDDAPAIQAACDQCYQGGAEVIIPGTASFYRCNTAITLASGGIRIRGDGTQPALRFYGCNGFVLNAGLSNLNISGLGLFGCDAAGTLDPKTFGGIVTSGTTGAHCNYIFLKDLYLQGWDRCVDWSYTWNSNIANISTINCNKSVRIFGQSCINAISSARLVANTGTHSVQLVKDGATRGEGLLISDTVMDSGTYGLQSDGFLGLHIDNCEADLIQDTAFDLTNVHASEISNCWIFAANYGIRLRDLGAPQAQYLDINACRIETTAANSRPIAIGALNSGIAITGGTLVCGASGTARCLFIEAFTTDVDISMVGTHLINANAATANSIFAGSPGFRHAGLTGDVTIQYFAPDSYLGTLTQVTGTITGTIVISETADLITLQIPMIVGASPNVNQPKITGMPASILPLTQQVVMGIVQNNSIDAVSKITVDTNGDLTLYTGVAAAFAAANNKGVNVCTITYRRF